MMRRVLPFLILAAAGVAQAQEAPKPKLSAHLLSAAELDATRILPPPPAPGSATANAELAELRAVIAARTPQSLAHAKNDDETEDASIFAEAMGPGFDLRALPATAKLMAEVRVEEKAAASAAKALFKRQRPWIVDDKLDSCSREDPPLTSYPSGHTTMGFSMAVVLADLAPSHAPALLARAKDYAESRIVCGMHFRSDIVAGQVLGTSVGQALLRNPALAADREAAAAELRAARLAP